jgi:hypothetical protein
LLHALLQQTPSDTKPLAHLAATVESWPSLSEQTPLASQVRVPEHPAGSSALTMAVHAPPGEHVLHGPTQEVLQHAPPSTGLAQTHVPVASHVWEPEHPFGSGALMMGRHVPVEHDLHTPLQAVEQQTPSTQLLLTQSAFA